MIRHQSLARTHVFHQGQTGIRQCRAINRRKYFQVNSLPPSSAEKVTVYFKAADKVVEATPGENIVEVAQRSGVVINVGCCSNSCGICEVEVVKISDDGVHSPPCVARSCVAGIPPGYARIEIDDISDAIWGVDGFDT